MDHTDASVYPFASRNQRQELSFRDEGEESRPNNVASLSLTRHNTRLRAGSQTAHDLMKWPCVRAHILCTRRVRYDMLLLGTASTGG